MTPRQCFWQLSHNLPSKYVSILWNWNWKRVTFFTVEYQSMRERECVSLSQTVVREREGENVSFGQTVVRERVCTVWPKYRQRESIGSFGQTVIRRESVCRWAIVSRVCMWITGPGCCLRDVCVCGRMAALLLVSAMTVWVRCRQNALDLGVGLWLREIGHVFEWLWKSVICTDVIWTGFTFTNKPKLNIKWMFDHFFCILCYPFFTQLDWVMYSLITTNQLGFNLVHIIGHYPRTPASVLFGSCSY